MSSVYANQVAEILPDGWSVRPFEEMVFFQEGPGIRNWQYVPKGIPFVNIRCLVDGRLDRAAMSHVSEDEALGKYKHFLLDADDYVVSSSGTLGRIATVDRSDLPCILNTSVIRMRPRGADLERRFLKYFLASDYYQSQILSFATGSAQLNYGPMHLRQMFIVAPPLPEQRAIAHILGTLDDKIELNRRRNQTLEAMARALFKDWFVDFGPVRAKMEGREPYLPADLWQLFPDRLDDEGKPEGWEMGKLGDLVDTVKGRSYKSEELVESDTALVTLKSFAKGGGYRLDGLKSFSGTYKAEQVVTPGEVVIACTDVTQAAEVIGRPAIVRGTGGYRRLVASLDTLIVRPRDPRMSRAFLYFLCGTEAFVTHSYAHTTGTTVLHLAKEAVPSFMFARPSEQLVQSFDSAAAPALDRIQALEAESAILAQLRDTLLPKLISGELRVKDAEKFIEAAQ